MQIIQIQLQDDEKIAFICDLHYDNHTPDSRIDEFADTAIWKLEDVLSKCLSRNVKHLFFEGDIFNRITVTHECVNRLAECLLKFREKGIKLYSICGNHDILRNSLENIERSPIQTLFTFGVMEHINLNKRVIINKKTMITPVDYTEYPPKAEPSAKTNILLAHMFYNVSNHIADERHNLSKEDVLKLGYDLIVLGHDHEEYKTEKCGNTYIVRSGSVLRGTAHNYNFSRKPKFVVLNDIENINENTIEMVEIIHREYKDIASSYVLNRKKLSSASSLEDVLTNLAVKLTEDSELDGDRIWNIINSDTELPSECRTILLKYINES